MRESIRNVQQNAKKVVRNIFPILLFAAIFITSFTLVNAQTKTGNAITKEEQTESTQNIGSFDLTGTWIVTISPDDGTPPFIGYYTFNSDGNVSFSSAGPPNPALGNPGYGVWKQVRLNKFAATVRQNTYTTTFQFDGTLKILSNIRMTGNDTFVTNDTVKIYDVAGNEVVTLGGSAIGKRMIVEN